MAGVAVVAGGSLGRALILGGSMTLLQLGIGTVNDIVDAPSDAGLKPGKPIPVGIVPIGAARWLAAVCFAAGLALALAATPAVAALAVVVVVIGLAYDLWLKGTAWSWPPFALGIPILPVYGWVGARGDLDPWFAILVPVAVLAGAALAIANSLVDIERDEAAGRTSIAARLGRPRASRVAAAVFCIVLAVDAVTLLAAGAAVAPTVASVLAAALAAMASGIAMARPELAERAWQAEAVGLGVAAVSWTVAIIG